jgi:GH24 family phage-related lysozyme (muramidase)
MPLDNRISNIIGTPLPDWIKTQIKTRSDQNTKDLRDNENLIYLANKTGWVRLVSSIDLKYKDALTPSADIRYFETLTGNPEFESSMARKFVLFGGISAYTLHPGQGGGFSYELRQGLSGTYDTLGESEIRQFGYRPMPGISNVIIETMGRLGSLRKAKIDFQVWDKYQLDVIDLLYFKLGYTMLLEFGHTYFYNSSNNLEKGEDYMIDPFKSCTNNQKIQLEINRKVRESEGNYDAMIGIVTNFSFSLNAEAGYDCTIELLSGGVVGQNAKINHPEGLPDLLESEIEQYSNLLAQIEQANRAKELAEQQKTLQEQLNANKKDKLTVDGILKDNAASGSLTVNQYIAKYGRPNSKEVPGLYNKYDIRVKVNTHDSLIIRRFGQYIFYDQGGNRFQNINLSVNYNFVSDLFKVDYNNYKSEIESSVKAGIAALGVNGSTISVLSQQDYVKDRILIGREGVSYPNFYRYEIKYLNPNKSLEKYAIRFTISIPSGEDEFKISEQLADIFQDYLFSLIRSEKVMESVNFVNIIDENKTTSEVKIKISAKYKHSAKVLSEESGAGVTRTIETLQDLLFPITIEFSDTYVIEDLTIGDQISTLADYLEYKNKLEQQNISQSATVQSAEDVQNLEAEKTQLVEKLKYNSAIEIILKAIQLHSLTEAYKIYGQDSLNKVIEVPLWKKDSRGKSFVGEAMKYGVFSDVISELMGETIKSSPSTITIPNVPNGTSIDPSSLRFDGSQIWSTSQNQQKPFPEIDQRKKELYRLNNENISDKDLFKFRAKYGFWTELMAGSLGQDNKDLINKEVNYKDLFTSYVIPYQVNQNMQEGGLTLVYPTYIKLSTLFMLINHMCTLTQQSECDRSLKTPFFYLDFNANVNYCLSHPSQLSTDPFKFLIPFQGTNKDYINIFDKEIYNKLKDNKVKLFQPQQEDAISGAIPQYKDNSPYTAKLLNVLINCNYAIEVISQYAKSDSLSEVFFKDFIEKLLSDLNKSIGNFNAFSLVYNDKANTYHVIDSQYVNIDGEGHPINSKELGEDLPLYGKKSIAKSLEIRSEVSSRMANMLAISANSTPSEQSQNSTDSTAFGYVNTYLSDRYVGTKLGNSNSGSIKSNTDIEAATLFDDSIRQFYSTVNPSQNNVPSATNYYILSMSKIRVESKATRASAMIPVSVNLTMHGLGGLPIFSAFTIQDELLPYTYNIRSVVDNNPRKVGFVIVGKTDTISSDNVWNTSIKGQMLPLKEPGEFSGQVSKFADDAKDRLLLGQLLNSNIDLPTFVGDVILDAVEFIKSFEGLYSAQPNAYLRVNSPINANTVVYAYKQGNDKPTIGWGTTRYQSDMSKDKKGQDVRLGDSITVAQASAEIQFEVANLDRYLRANLKSYDKLTKNQKVVLISLGYNAGSGNLSKSKVWEAINSGQNSQIVAQSIKTFATTIAGDGADRKPVRGLITRREKESQLYLS